ncbi:MAG: integrase arm-type DNA-binding domain-containing protein, partial [Alphaproteobacteria bacterium]|nr:integrase arm-type DNA-binding domain-containing protein [Alphaproteobacteria bacterium]
MPKLTEKALSALTVEKLKPRADRYDVYDVAIRGLGVRVSPAGTKSWFVMRRVNGRMIRRTIGRYPDVGLSNARRQAAETLEAMSNGVHTAANQALTFAAAVEEWLDRDQSKNRSRDQAEAAMRRDALPAFRNLRLDHVVRSDIIRLLDGVVDRGAPIVANRLLAYLNRLYRWAIERGYIEANPASGIRPPHREISRDRVLNDGELRALLKACGEIGHPFGPFTKLLLLTGQRRCEVAQMTWPEIDLDTGNWTIAGERTKNGRPHLVHLSMLTTKLL